MRIKFVIEPGAENECSVIFLKVNMATPPAGTRGVMSIRVEDALNTAGVLARAGVRRTWIEVVCVLTSMCQPGKIFCGEAGINTILGATSDIVCGCTSRGLLEAMAIPMPKTMMPTVASDHVITFPRLV